MKSLLSVLLILLGSTFSIFVAADDDADYVLVVQQINQQGDEAIKDYQPSSGWDSADVFSNLYFDLFEGSGLESAIALKSPGTKTHLESLFGSLIGQAGQGADALMVAASWQELKAALNAAAPHYQQTEMDATAIFIQSLLILLREGFEALLVITALAAYIRRQKIPGGQRVVSYGVGLALIASLLTAWLMTSVIETSGPQREALEGVTLIIATIVLLYVSGWLFSKREADRWQQYIRAKVDGSVKRGSLWALGFAIFLAVYREGAETVLFYQALYSQALAETTALWAGFASALLILLGLYWALTRLSLKIPMGLFFSCTALLIFVLAFMFAGNGVLELQRAGWVSATPLSYFPRLTWLGIHPTIETLAAQGLVLLLPLIVWMKMGLAASEIADKKAETSKDAIKGDAQ